MSVYCKNCINAVESNLPSGELFCKVFRFPCDEILGCSRETKTQTNFDKVTANIDSLIEFYCYGRPCGNCPYGGVECNIREWLKQEATE